MVMECEVLDLAFDTDGILYSGYLPPAVELPSYEQPNQAPLTELELRVRAYWRSRKDPINLVIAQS